MCLHLFSLSDGYTVLLSAFFPYFNMKSLFHSEFFDATRYMVFSHGLKLLKIYLFFVLGLQKKNVMRKIVLSFWFRHQYWFSFSFLENELAMMDSHIHICIF